MQHFTLTRTHRVTCKETKETPNEITLLAFFGKSDLVGLHPGKGDTVTLTGSCEIYGPTGREWWCLTITAKPAWQPRKAFEYRYEIAHFGWFESVFPQWRRLAHRTEDCFTDDEKTQ